MRYNSKLNKSKKRRTTIVLTLVILVIAASASLFIFARRDKSTVEPLTTEQKYEANATADTNYSPKSKEPTANKTPVNTDANSVPVNNTVTVTIGDIKQSNNEVTSSAQIAGATKSGECVFTFTSDQSKPVVKQASSKNNICQVVIYEAEFDKIGEWQLKVTFFDQQSKAEATKNVVIS